MQIDTKDLKTKKYELSARLYNVMKSEIIKFEAETGLSVCNILLDFENITAYSDEYPKFCLGNVRVKLSPDL